MHIGKAKQVIHSLVAIRGQGTMFCCFEERMAPSYVTVTWDKKCRKLKCPSTSTFFPIVLAEYRVRWSGISLGWLGVSCPLCVPSQLLMHIQPLHWWGGGSSSQATERNTQLSQALSWGKAVR